jgi:4-aminobutyrate aminotransferase-like enzyme
MTSTHSASPLPVVAAIESMKVLEQEGLVDKAAELGGELLGPSLKELQQRYPRQIGAALCRGLVGGLLMVRPGTTDPDPDAAQRINEACFQKGLLMFAPVGLGGDCVKIAPPLVTPRDALAEALGVLAEACAEVLS